jgi:hypothetical protein
MLPDVSKLASRWLSGAQSAWPLFLIAVVFAALVGYELAAYRLRPTSPPFTFANGTSTIEASGAWHSAGALTPNATSIFCWFPASTCSVTVAELLTKSARSSLQLHNTEFDITQLSDATLAGTASTTDPCYVETLRIDRAAHAVTLATGPSGAAQCAGTPTKTATLGE